MLFRPRRPRQLRRRVALPTGAASAGSGVDSVAPDDLSAGGFGADRPLLVPFDDEDPVPPTRRRVGVRRMFESLVLPTATSSLSGAVCAAAVLRDVEAGLRVRVVAVRRGFVPAADVVGFRVPDRREVAAFVAALSSPFGEAASSDTS
ncbi:MAG: hypothetical protein H8D69_01275, partial [Chloroflexi bacterium]|nr:hypothetical protein [Chloroflexota bacterium]